MPVVFVLVGVFLLVSAVKAGEMAGHALWLWLALGLVGFAAVALLAWTRREVERIHHLHHDNLTHWLRVEKFKPWPKWCQRCGYRVHSWRELSAHDSDTSPCALLDRYQAGQEGREAGLPAGMGWKVDDVTGAADDDGQAAELDERRAAEAIEG